MTGLYIWRLWRLKQWQGEFSLVALVKVVKCRGCLSFPCIPYPGDVKMACYPRTIEGRKIIFSLQYPCFGMYQTWKLKWLLLFTFLCLLLTYPRLSKELQICHVGKQIILCVALFFPVITIDFNISLLRTAAYQLMHFKVLNSNCPVVWMLLILHGNIELRVFTWFVVLTNSSYPIFLLLCIYSTITDTIE